MQGQKQLFIFLVVMIFVFTFSFYKKLIKNEKELTRNHDEELRRNLETNNIYGKHDKINKIKQLERKQRKMYLEKFLEHRDKCYDIHAIIFRPEFIEAGNEHNNNNQVETQRKETVDQAPDTKSKNSVVTGPIIYLCVIVLICSLVKAATDMSNQLSKKSDEDPLDPRRFSLQEYANNKHRRSSKASPLLRRATTLTMESRLKPKQQSLDERRTIPEFNTGSGLLIEPGSAKKTNGIASRPAPLLRRCSVPVFALQQAGHGLRRPSIDSFSEDDSSPDVKRRVRMIHRH